MDRKDYYEILGIDRNATPQKIKEVYRRLAFEYHPDRNTGNPSAVEKMKDINEAYAVLSDPAKRGNYNRLRDAYGIHGYSRFKESYSEQDIFKGSDINRIFEEMSRAFGFRSFDEVFGESYGQGYQTFAFRRPGVFGRGFVFFGPSSSRVQGAESTALSDVPPGPFGTLARYLLKKVLGIQTPERGVDWTETIVLNPAQARKGGRARYFHRKRSKELVVTIPSGLRDGQKVRLKGMGAEGRNGGEAGDLYLRIRIQRPRLKILRKFFESLFKR
jgi:DnaJ-class molecular chaperone